MGQAFIGIDVGTSSTRAGVFDEQGNLLATARQPIQTWQEAGDIVEQSSADIWNACASSVRAAMAEAALSPDVVKGIGFDATCSLVVLDPSGAPLTVSTSGDINRNVMANPNPFQSGAHAEALSLARAISDHLEPKTTARSRSPPSAARTAAIPSLTRRRSSEGRRRSSSSSATPFAA